MSVLGALCPEVSVQWGLCLGDSVWGLCPEVSVQWGLCLGDSVWRLCPGDSVWGLCPGEEVSAWRNPPFSNPVNRMTDTSKNITLPQLSFAGSNIDIERKKIRLLLIKNEK